MPNLQESLQVLNFFRAVGAVKERKEEARKAAAFESHKYAAEQYRKKREFILTKSIAYMDGLKEGPSKDLARARFKDHIGSWEPWEREAFAPYISKVFTPDQEKKAEFLRTWGDRPVVDKNPADDPLGYGQQDLAGKRYDWQFTKFMGGESGSYPEYASVDKETALLHKQGDIPRLINLENEALGEITKSLHGSPTPEMVVANRGEWPMEAPVIYDAGPHKMKTTKMARVVGKDAGTYTKTEKLFTDPTIKAPEPSKDLTDFFSFYASGMTKGEAEKSPLGRHYVGWLDGMEAGEDPNTALRHLRKATGVNIKILEPGEFKSPWLSANRYIKTEKEVLLWWPGDMQMFPGKDETILGWYHDKPTDQVYDGMGQSIGTYDEALKFASEIVGEKIE